MAAIALPSRVHPELDTPDAWEDSHCISCQHLAADIDGMRGDLEQATQQLARAHQVLRAIKRLEVKPARPEGFDDDAAANLATAYAQSHAAIKTRIDLYLASVREVPS